MAQAELKLNAVAFTKAVRGYSCEEVDTYLAYVNDQYTALAKEFVALRRKMTAQAAGQNEFREEALREKEKIAAEADALYRNRKAEADQLMDTAKRTAARMLADAENAAAEIKRKAEAEAAELVESNRAAAEEYAAAGQVLVEKRQAAERMAMEIDSFRETVFGMYAKHIEALEQLSSLTDAFYETTDALSGEVVAESDFETDAEEVAAAVPDMMAEELEEESDFIEEDPEALSYADEEAQEDWDAEILPEDETDSDLLRIDWSKRLSESVEDDWQLIVDGESVDEAEEQDVPAAGGMDDDALLEELHLLFDDGEAEAEDEETFPFLQEEELEEEPDTMAAEAVEDDFLSDLASEYLKPKKAADEPVQKKKEQPAPEKKPKDFDELLNSENGGLTGEFDRIYSASKSADIVAQIRKQPLIDAQKPTKKKPGRK